MSADLIHEFGRWERRRAAQGRLENIGRARADDWHASDDHAVDLLRRAMAVIDQVRNMFDVIGEALADHQGNGAGFTCSEAETMHEVMEAVGYQGAQFFMVCHADTDTDEGDLHVVTERDEHGNPSNYGPAPELDDDDNAGR